MALKLITAPTFEPVSLAEAKAHCRVDTSDDNDLISSLIEAVRLHLEGRYGWLNRALVTQTWELHLDAFPSAEIKIPLPPLQSVSSIKYDDLDGVEQTVSSLNYDVDTVSEPGWVIPGDDFTWPPTLDAVNSVRVRFVAGWPSDAGSPEIAQTPAAIKAAMKMMIADIYENRESVVVGTVTSTIKIPTTAENLLYPFQVFT